MPQLASNTGPEFDENFHSCPLPEKNTIAPRPLSARLTICHIYLIVVFVFWGINIKLPAPALSHAFQKSIK